VEEDMVLTALNRWAEAECGRIGKSATPSNKKAAMGDLINLVRFPLLDMNSVLTILSPMGLLSSDETISLISYINTKMPNC